MFNKKEIKDFGNIEKDSVFLHYTGNMFGIGCSAFNLKAIKRVSSYKKRDFNKGYIVLLPDITWIKKYSIIMDSDEERIFRQFSPGNLTMILRDGKNLFEHISQNGKIAVRIPEDAFLRNFIKDFGEPIISTSVNTAGESPLTNLKKIKSTYAHWFDYLILPPKIEKKSPIPSTIIEFTPDEIKCIREGSIPMKQIENAYLHPMITFVCTANICRSPMAEYYFKKLIYIKKLPFETMSAGFLNSGNRISENSMLVLKENGIEAENHLSTQLNSAIVTDSQLILTMTQNHKETLIDYFPNSLYKTYTLIEYYNMHYPNDKWEIKDIEDPFTMSIEKYRETFKLIKFLLDKIVDKIPY